MNKEAKPLSGSLQVKNGKYYAVVGYTDVITRKRKMKWISLGYPEGTKKSVLNKAMREALAEFEEEYRIMEKGIRSPDEYPLLRFLSEWLDNVKRPSIQISTYNGYRKMINGKITRFFGDKFTLGDINPRTVTAFYEEFRKEGLGERTILHYHNLLHEACKYAVRQEIFDANPMDRLERPKAKKYKAQYYTPEEIQTLLALIKDDVIYIPVVLGAYYGLRRSETVGLSWSNIDFEKNILYIAQKAIDLSKDGKTNVLISEDMKNDSSRRALPLIPSVKKILLEHKAQQETYRKMFRSDYSRKYLDMVCVDPLGEIINPDRITERFPVLLEKYKLRKIRFHDLRHSCASMLIADKKSLKEIQMWLGHSSITTTADTYGHLDESAKLGLGESIQKLLGTYKEDNEE